MEKTVWKCVQFWNEGKIQFLAKDIKGTPDAV